MTSQGRVYQLTADEAPTSPSSMEGIYSNSCVLNCFVCELCPLLGKSSLGKSVVIVVLVILSIFVSNSALSLPILFLLGALASTGEPVVLYSGVEIVEKTGLSWLLFLSKLWSGRKLLSIRVYLRLES